MTQAELASWKQKHRTMILEFARASSNLNTVLSKGIWPKTERAMRDTEFDKTFAAIEQHLKLLKPAGEIK